MRFKNNVFNRLYSDFLLPSRLDEYKKIMEFALDNDYEMHSVFSFWQLLKQGKFNDNRKYFINRHDIDTDVATARLILDVEKQLGIISSYYFRLSTIDLQLMRQIDGHGSEASYHYEEVASFAKKHKIKNAKDIIKNLDRIRDDFRKNLKELRDYTGLPMYTVASHGDFVNRKLGIPNHIILLDENLREELGIELEVYDTKIMKYVTSRHSDTLYPIFYKPSSPIEAIKKGEKVIYFLTHPRHWRSNPLENLKDDINRIWEELKYGFG